MKRAALWTGSVISCLLANADTLTLKSGRSIQGTFLSGTTREMSFLAESGKSSTFALVDVESVSFSAILPPAAHPSATHQQTGVSIPAGTTVTVRLIEAVKVDTAAAGRRFRASIDDPVMIGGRVIIPRGADAVLQATKIEQSGKMKGSDAITLKLNQVLVHGTRYDLATSYNESKSAGEGKKTTRKVLGGAGLGAIVGGIIGGGKGAAIGAAAGGTGGAVVSEAGEVHLDVPAETRLQFQLMAAVTIR
jgi:YmgG-like glycine-zipper protein